MIIKSLIYALVATILFPLQGTQGTADVEPEIRRLEMLRLKFPSESDRWSGDVADGAIFDAGHRGHS